jgi:hypothetical protein
MYEHERNVHSNAEAAPSKKAAPKTARKTAHKASPGEAPVIHQEKKHASPKVGMPHLS